MNVRQLLDLGGRTALVTGGSRGLGLQIAEALGEMGASIAITARKQNELDDALAHLRARKIQCEAWVCDMGKREAIPPCADEVLKKFGSVDILVNNAGATWGAPAEDHPLEAWDKLVNLNLTGVFVLTQHIGKKSMIPARWGRIINVASIFAFFKCATASSNSFCLRAVIAMLAPISPSASAICSPSPREPPVTSAVRPPRSRSCRTFMHQS